jgi:HEAT repeat protein
MATRVPPFGLPAPARRQVNIAQNLRDLASRDDNVSRAALARLDDLLPTTAELLDLVGDRNPFVRSGAAWLLRRIPGEPLPEVVDALRAAACDPNPHVVEAALGSVGELRAVAARDDVRASLEDPNPRVAHAAVFALGRLGPSEEGRHLVRFLQSSEAHLVGITLTSLAHLRYTPAIGAVVALLESCLGAVRRARPHFDLPRRSIFTLVALKAREAVPLLVRIAQEEVGLRGIAVQALVDLKAAEAAPALLPLLGKLFDSAHEEKLCCGLLRLMEVVEYSFARAEVRRFLGHRVMAVRLAALRAVSRWRDREDLEAVRLMCQQDVSALARPAAVMTLTDLLGVEALPDLRPLADDANPAVRAAVAAALGRIEPLPAEGLKLLARLLADDATAQAAREALAQHAVSPEAAAALLPRPPASLVPLELQAQVAAARAFLKHWRARLSNLDGPAHDRAELERALGVLVRVLDGLASAPLAA